MGTKWNVFTNNLDLVNSTDGLVVGPAVSTDNAVCRFDGTTGVLLQNSGTTLSDADLLSTGELNLTTDLAVDQGGTGRGTGTAYSVVCSGTTATGAQQSVADVGTNGQVLTSGGASTLPTWTSVAGTGDVTAAANLTDNSLIRGNGGAKGVQDSGILIDDTDNLNLPTGSVLEVNSVETLSATALGAAVVGSSLTSVGTITTGTWGATDVTVANGGTGRSTSTTAYSVICAGTTATAAHQTVASVGTSGQALTSGGAGVLPTWTTIAGAGDVTAAANIGDNLLVRGDGAGKGIQNSGITIDDSDVVTGVTQLNVDNLRLDGNTLSSTDTNGNVTVSPDGTGIINTTSALVVKSTTAESDITIGGVTVDGSVFLHAAGATDLGELVVERHSDTAGFGGHQIFARSRGTEASETVVQDNDLLSQIVSVGHDGTDFEQAALIKVEVDGTPGAGDMPGRIIMMTSADGAATPIEGLRLDNSQVVTLANALPAASGGTSFGTFSKGDILYASAANTLAKLPIGTDNQVLAVNVDVPNWEAAAGGGNVSNTGTPVNNQLAIWTDATTVEGDAALTFDDATDTLAVAASGKFAFGAVNILDDTAGTTTLSNIDAIDATTETTLEAAIDSLTNLTAVGTITTGTWGATDVTVANGGTGRSSHTAYAVLCGGTTTTAAQQSIAGVGTTGQVLTSTGAGSLPTFQAAGASAMADFVVQWSAEALNVGYTPFAPIEQITTTNIIQKVRSFAYDTIEYCDGKFEVPPDMDTTGTITFSIQWFARTVPSPSENVIWQIEHSAVATTEDQDSATFTAEVAAASATGTTQNALVRATWTETRSNLGWVAGDTVFVKWSRKSTDANDTFDSVGTTADDALLVNAAIIIPQA